MRPHEIEFSTFEGGVFTDLMPYQYGREVCTPGHAFGPARRSHYLFHFILEGKGSLTATDEMGSATVHELHAGEGFLIFPGQITTYVADLDEPWEYIWIEFDGAHVKSNLDRLGFSPASPCTRRKTRSAASRWSTPCAACSSTAAPRSSTSWRAPTCSSTPSSGQRGRTARAPRAACTASTWTTPSPTSSRTTRATSRSRTSRATPGSNRSYFGKVFRDAMGVSPQQFLIGFRIEKACELLKLSNLSVGEVGRAVGYPNQLHFSRAFKNARGLSPRAWRQQHAQR